jgi:glycosyltransferase involved in cell wall biosynthesis
MKVKILTPPRLGGPFYWARDLADSLNDRGIKSEHVYEIRRLLLSPFYQNANIVHTLIPFPFKLWKKPVVLTILGDYTIEPNLWQRFYPKTIAQANAITVPSQHLKQKLGLNEAVVIPNAVLPERFKLAQHKARDELNLVTVMSFYFPDKVKGLLNIMEVLNKIQNHCFKYTIIGGGRYLDPIKHQIAETKVDVNFTGFLENPELALAASDIFLYYSYHDAFPIVILEAMSCGLPVITNNVGAVSEIIDNGEDGYIADSDESYLEYLLSLVGDYELRQKIGRKARAKVEEKFSWRRITGQYIQLYNKLLVS